MFACLGSGKLPGGRRQHAGGNAVKPVVIIGSDWRDETGGAIAVNPGYISAIIRAGATPLVAPPSEHFESFDAAATEMLRAGSALVLTGGQDIDPDLFGQTPHPKLGPVNPVRDGMDLALAREALRRGLPMLGICRGAQVMNVAAGGGLIQDIPSEVSNAYLHNVGAPRECPTHWVDIVPGTLLHRIVGETRLKVNSFHHQACAPVAPGFVQSASSGDGVVEAIERGDGGFALGVQWHPECMYHRYGSSMALFKALVEAARGGGR